MFAGVKSGDKVLEFVPGRGYVTRLLAKASATGRVSSDVPLPQTALTLLNWPLAPR
jgi:predicted methyltransferase